MTITIQGDKPIGLASDHAGYSIKQYIIDLFDKQGVKYIDYGTYSTESTDYSDYGHKLGTAIDNGECDFGVAVCGTGNGINMTLNKHASSAFGFTEKQAILQQQNIQKKQCFPQISLIKLEVFTNI